MSSIVLSPGATGAAAFTIEAPSTATSRVITLPDATDTLVGKATTDTLTNKSIAATQLTGTVAAARMPAGSIVQVVFERYTTAASVGNTSTDTSSGFTATITPTSASNKILVIFASTMGNSQDSTQMACSMRKNIASAGFVATTFNINIMAYFNNVSAYIAYQQIAFSFTTLDSPATTSSTVYSPFFYGTHGASSGTAYLGGRNNDGLNASTSTITLMEVVA